MQDPHLTQFADRLRGAMKRAKVSGIDLADAAGVIEGTVSEWRGAKYAPDGERLEKVAKKLGVSSTWLLHGDRPKGASLTADELRGYAIAVRDMLESARVSQQRIIDGLSRMADAPHKPTIAHLKTPRPKKDVASIPLKDVSAHERKGRGR